MTWIRIHFLKCGSRIRIRIKITWILSADPIKIKKDPKHCLKVLRVEGGQVNI